MYTEIFKNEICAHDKKVIICVHIKIYEHMYTHTQRDNINEAKW